MRDRCTRPTHKFYADYGGRGIRVCKRWMKFENFLADMGEAPRGLTLDRTNNNRGYSKQNCRWVTRSVNQKNKRSTKFYTDGSFVGTLVECAAHLGITKSCAFERWNNWGSFSKDTKWRVLPRNV